MDEGPRDTRDNRLSGAPDTWPLSALDAARSLGVSERTVRRAIARGDLPATKQGGVYRIAPEALAGYQSRSGSGNPARPAQPAGRIALPLPPTALIGRKEERAEATRLLLREGVRVVTLTGPGGVGKTHLASSIATDVADVFADGAYFVDLSPVRNPDLVSQSIAQAIGLRETGQRSIDEAVTTYLRPRELLLVLDNMEQIIAAAPRIADLIARCPDLHVLVTSRIPLRIRGERRLPVDPLPTHDLPGVPIQSAASQLFIERARAVDPALAETEDNLEAIAGICQRLDGLPLAIELAAAWSALLPPADLLAQLSDRMRTPGHAPRDLPDRQRTVADTIAWSYDLLAPEEQALFRRLGVFVDGFDHDDAIAIADTPAVVVTARLGALVEQSLLRRVQRPGKDARFAMLETVREFAWQQAMEQGEAQEIAELHAAYYLDLAERIELVLYGAEMRYWLQRLEDERPNCIAALRHFIEIGDATRELRLAGKLSEYWYYRGQISEGIAALRGALARGEAAPPGPRSRVMSELGYLLWATGAANEARSLLAASVPLIRQTGDIYRLAQTLFMWADVLHDHEGQETKAIALLEETISLIDSHQQPLGLHTSVQLDLHASALADLGDLWLGKGDRERGIALLGQALTMFEGQGDQLGIGQTHLRLSRLAWQDGDIRLAAEHYGKSLRGYRESGIVTQAGLPFAGLWKLVAGSGYPESAARIAGMAQAIADRTGASFDGDWTIAPTQAEPQSPVALGSGYSAEIESGMSLSLDDAFAEAIAVADALATGKPPPGTTGSSPPRPPVALSPRENDVLALLAQRYTAPEIADQLFLSVRTVERHVANVYNKLGVNSRRAAIATATHYRLVQG